MGNKLKNITTEEPLNTSEQEVIKKANSNKKIKKRSGLVHSLNLIFSGTFLGNDSILKHVPFVLFLTALGIFYIANGYWADEKLIQVNKLDSQIKELRTEYIATKSELMFTSKQSEVALVMEKWGLKEPITPPMKIVARDSVLNTTTQNDHK